MTTVGVISDTHNTLNDDVINFLAGCDVVIHAGDIGSTEIADKLKNMFNFVGVYGNTDNHLIRAEYKEIARIMIEDVKVMITHIGSYMGRYYPEFRDEIIEGTPDIVICGHSHILKVGYNKELSHLHINPGACGYEGIHAVRTAVRFKIEKKRIYDLEVIEWKRY